MIDQSTSPPRRPQSPRRPRGPRAAAIVALGLALSVLACTDDSGGGCSEPVRERNISSGMMEAGPAGITRALGQSHNAPIIQMMEEAGAGGDGGAN